MLRHIAVIHHFEAVSGMLRSRVRAVALHNNHAGDLFAISYQPIADGASAKSPTMEPLSIQAQCRFT